MKVSFTYSFSKRTVADCLWGHHKCSEEISKAVGCAIPSSGKGRKTKQSLVNSLNPGWKDLYDDLIKD